jgi:hypothetical protein
MGVRVMEARLGMVVVMRPPPWLLLRQKKVCVCALCVGGRGLYFFGTRIHVHIHMYMYIYMCTCT